MKTKILILLLVIITAITLKCTQEDCVDNCGTIVSSESNSKGWKAVLKTNCSGKLIKLESTHFPAFKVGEGMCSNEFENFKTK